MHIRVVGPSFTLAFSGTPRRSSSLPTWSFVPLSKCVVLLLLAPAAGEFSVGPNEVLICGAATLVLAKNNLPELFQIGYDRFIVVSPMLFVGTFRLESPGATSLYSAGLTFQPIVRATHPGVTIVHNDRTLVCRQRASTLIPFSLERRS